MGAFFSELHMFKFCLLFAGVAFLEKLDTILRQKTANFKATNIHFNWIACAILRLKTSADIVPLIKRDLFYHSFAKYDLESHVAIKKFR